MLLCKPWLSSLGKAAEYMNFCRMVLGKITVKIIDFSGTEVATQTFINPPKDAVEILDRLAKAGYEGALLNAEGDSLSGRDPLDDTQEYRLKLPAMLMPVPGGEEALVRVAKRAAAEAAHEFHKTLRFTVTSPLEEGKLILDICQINERHFEERIAGLDHKVVDDILGSDAGKELASSWQDAAQEENVQVAGVKLARIILKKRKKESGKTVLFDTHNRGLVGNQMKMDGMICDRYRQAPHVETFLEKKSTLNRGGNHAEAVGQCKGRVRRLAPNQPQRSRWMCAVIGKDSFQLLDLPTDGVTGPVFCTPLYGFDFSASSSGLQMLVRWLMTPVQNWGYIPPELPRNFSVSRTENVTVEMKLLENASQNELSGKPVERPGVMVFKGMLKQPGQEEDVVVKVPGSDELADHEMMNLQIVEKIPTVAESCIRLRAAAHVTVGGVQRPALVLQPVGELIPLDISPAALVDFMKQLVLVIDCLHRAGYLHRDLSYFNILVHQSKPILVDFQTLSRADSQDGGVLIGTPLFAALGVLKGEPHCIGTELESLFYVLLYVLSRGILFWRHTPLQDHSLYSSRCGAMWAEFDEKILKPTPSTTHTMLTRMRDLFFHGGKYTGRSVTCEQFLAACSL